MSVILWCQEHPHISCHVARSYSTSICVVWRYNCNTSICVVWRSNRNIYVLQNLETVLIISAPFVTYLHPFFSREKSFWCSFQPAFYPCVTSEPFTPKPPRFCSGMSSRAPLPRVNPKDLYTWASSELLDECSCLLSTRAIREHKGDSCSYDHRAFA